MVKVNWQQVQPARLGSGAGWLVLGALTAGWIAPNRRPWFAGGIVLLALLGSLNNWRMFEHPTWFVAGQLIAYPLVFLGAVALLRSVPGRPRGTTAP